MKEREIVNQKCEHCMKMVIRGPPALFLNMYGASAAFSFFYFFFFEYVIFQKLR